MKYKIMGAVSALALLVAVTAYTEANAADVNATTQTHINANATTEASPTLSERADNAADNAKADLKAGWEQTKEAARDAGDKTRAEYDSIKARVIGETDTPSDVTVESRMTAKGMIGQPVYNTKQEKIGTLKDIILDNSGRARIAVVSDGGFMGIGDKLAAFDYGLVMQQNADGDVIMPLNEDTVSKVAAFSYNPKEASDTIQIVPADSYSVAELLKGKLIDPRNKSMGNIENITFAGGEASRVIVAFDQKLGVGGERAALDFDDLSLSKQANGSLDFRMNDRQSAQFEQYKNTQAN